MLLACSDFLHLFGNGTSTGSIGKNSVLFPPNWENKHWSTLFSGRIGKCKDSLNSFNNLYFLFFNVQTPKHDI